MPKTSESNWYCHHSTRNELDFIDGLGSFGGSLMPRRYLLRRYLEAARSRTDWGNIDADIIIERVETELSGGHGHEKAYRKNGRL